MNTHIHIYLSLSLYIYIYTYIHTYTYIHKYTIRHLLLPIRITVISCTVFAPRVGWPGHTFAGR